MSVLRWTLLMVLYFTFAGFLVVGIVNGTFLQNVYGLYDALNGSMTHTISHVQYMLFGS